jgi:signal transduction histidine kinase/CheY-like chemotaxis protein
MSTPSVLNDTGSLQQYHVGSVLRPAPLMAPSTTCGTVAETFISNPSLQAIVIPLEGGGFGLAARGTYLPEYLQGWNRDLFQRKPITQLMEHDPLVVPEDTPVDQVAMLVSSQRPEVLKSAFIITRAGVYAGIGTGLDLLRAVALRAQQASAAKSTFLAHMSHEIRTPLNAVIGNLELLAETPLAGEQGELARIARVSAQTVIEIIGDLLDLSKIEADRLELEIVDVDLRRVVEEARTIMVPRARAKNLRLGVLVGANVPAIARTDPLRLRQVLINFAGNACKFTSTGGVFLHVGRQEERDDKGRVWLRFEVVDTGPGFDPQRAAALFEPYVQEGASTSRLHGGTGLGLAINKRIVERLGGTIGCDTEPGWGSTFWCTIPMPVVAESPERSLPQFPELLLVAGPGAMPDNLQKWLEQQGAQVTRVADTQAESVVGSFSHVVQWRESSDAASNLTSDDARAADSRPLREGTQLIVTGGFSAAEAASWRYRAYRQGAIHVLSYPEQREELRQVLAEAQALPLEAPTEARVHQPIQVTADFPPVLIIDDAATNRALAERQLARLGFSTVSAENGLEGLNKATAGNYSLILVDDSMPVMDGPTFTQNYRQFERAKGRVHVPVIAMTAHALRGDAERLMAAGMDDYLPKPVTLDRLEAMLRTWLSSRIALSAASRPGGAPASDSAINLPRLAEMLGLDDPATMADLLSVFVADLPQLLEQVAQALAGRDRAALASAAHAAKGAAASAAAQHLGDLLACLERDAQTAAFEQLAYRFDLVRAESARVQAQVADLCSSGGSST